MAEFKLSRLKYNWKGDWQPDFNYILDDIVRFGAKSYVCIARHTSSTQSFYSDAEYINTDTIPPSSEPRWELMFDGYEWRGDWTPSTVYNVGDLVKYKAIVYVCLTSHTSAIESVGLESNQLNWASYARNDDWKGDWQPSTTYSVNDVVKYGGILYRCVARNTSADQTGGLESDIDSWAIINPAQQWRRDWTIDTRYRRNDVVKYGGIVYRCIQGHTSASSSDDGLEADQSNWEIVLENYEYKGDFAGDVRYKRNDIVKYGAGTWVCTIHHISQVETGVSVFDTDNWQVFLPGFEYENEWNFSTVYQKGDIVKYGGYSYEALNNSIGEIPSAVQDDDSTVAFWRLLTVGFTIKGEWEDNTSYLVGEVIRRRGQLYVAIQDNTTDPNDSPIDWELIVPGEQYQGEWLLDEEYAVGDIVVFESNTYRCITHHTASNNNSRPDNDYDNNLWTLLIQGEPTNSLRYQGDLKVFGPLEDGSSQGQSRLPISSQGKTLQVNDSGMPEWVTFNQATRVYFVGPTGVDENGYGDSQNAPFRTIKYACQSAIAPATIFIKVGTYSEVLPIKVPRDVALVGEELRSTIVEPATGYETSDMFWVNNGTGIRNMTLRGLSGTLGPINQYGTRRPTAGAYVSLDPGDGPDDTSVWITSKSCYVQNVTTFGTGCVGLKVDGALHDGGNKSVVANDFTQVLSDGIGVWVTNNALSELVSVFSYYGHAGYLAENGGKIRATNGNSSYGDYGTVAEGVDETETPVDTQINNRTTDATVVSAFSGEASDEILNLEFSHAGQHYTQATFNFVGSGVGASTVADEFRDGGIFEWRLLDPPSGSQLGGAGFQSTGNNAQGGNTTGITIAGNDENLPEDYIGARLIITSGTGTGQYGIITDYNIINKRVEITNEYSGEPGWTHVIPGYPSAAALDTTTVYRIEPRPITAAPPYVASSTVGVSGPPQDSIYIKEHNTFILAGQTGDLSGAALYVGTDEQLVSPVISTATGDSEFYSAIAYGNDTVVAVARKAGDPDLTGIASVGTWNGSSFDFVNNNSTGLDNYTDVTFGNGIFVATSLESETELNTYDPNTDTWTVRTFSSLGAGDYLTAVTYGKNKFVAVSTVGETRYSSDGITWSSGNNIPAFGDSTQPVWKDVAYGMNRFVAISSTSNAVAMSFDGITWYLSTLPFDTEWTRIKYAQGLFVAISESDTSYVAVSDSGGKYWELKELSSSIGRNAVAFINDDNNNRWVTHSANSGTIDIFKYGATFRCRPVLTGGRIQSVKIWEPGSGYQTQPSFTLFDPLSTDQPEFEMRIGDGVIANPTFLNRGVGYKTSTTRVTISGDGYADVYPLGGNLILDGASRIIRTGANFVLNQVDWITSVTPLSGPFSGVTASNDKFVAIINNPVDLNQVIYSSNGEGWTAAEIPVQISWTDVKYANGVFYAISSGNVYAKSTDGETWTVDTLPVSDNWISIDYLNDRWVIIANESNKVLYSTDNGDTWESALLPNVSPWVKVKHGANTFIAISENSDSVATSIDGQSWNLKDVGLTKDWKNMAYGSDKIILVADNSNQVAVSEDDGESWAIENLPVSKDWKHIEFANRKFIIWGYDSNDDSTVVYTSRNGVDWLERSWPSTVDYPTATVAGLSKYLALTDNTSIVADDGTNNRVYRVLTVDVVSGTPGDYRLAVRVGPDFNRTTTPTHGTYAEIREKYSQVRLTGHDFLDIGTGNFEETNYPVLYTQGTLNRAPENEVYYRGGGRVFYTSTDQDGNFRVGELFAVDQATGVVTISADYFDLGGLTELRLGGIRVGGTGVVIREFSTDATFAADSNNVVPTQKAIKAYIGRRISGGGSDAATGTLVAGVVRIGGPNVVIGNTIDSYVQMPVKTNITKGIGGVMLAHSFFSDSFNSGLDYQELGRDLG